VPALDSIRRWLTGRSFSGPPEPPRAASLRIDRVAPWLFIGPAPILGQYQDLRRRGITHLLDLRDDASDDLVAAAEVGLSAHRFPIAPDATPSHATLQAIIAWLDSEADTGAEQAVYLHGAAGLVRTPTVAAALLLQHHLPLDEAIRIVLAARPEAQIPPAHRLWLRQVEARVEPHA